MILRCPSCNCDMKLTWCGGDTLLSSMSADSFGLAAKENDMHYRRKMKMMNKLAFIVVVLIVVAMAPSAWSNFVPLPPPCWKCGGHGSIARWWGGRAVCPKCRSKNIGNPVCWRCDGDGYVLRFWIWPITCPTCEGNGKLKRWSVPRRHPDYKRLSSSWH